MIGRISLFRALFAVFIVLGSVYESSTSEDAARKNLQKLSLANNELAFNIYREFIAENTENVFFSPFSISSAFGMLFYGAREETAEELRSVLGYEKADLPDELVHITFHQFLNEAIKSDPTNGNVLNLANAVLVDKEFGLLSEYGNDVEELYHATVEDVDFSRDGDKIAKEINSWAKWKTNGKIDKLVEELSPNTAMILLNAVYFKGFWKLQFDEESTRPNTFYNNGLHSEAKEVPFMHMTKSFLFTESEDFKALELPYKGDNISMLILLPNERDGLASLEESMTPEKLLMVQESMSDDLVKVSLPKFKLQSKKDLYSVIQALGAEKIFNPDEANFSGMTNSKNVFVNEVLHEAVIEVNEKGSEASAITFIGGFRSIPIIYDFMADHPFLFAIIEKGSESNMIMFLGRVNHL